jgi:hypothetical protein
MIMRPCRSFKFARFPNGLAGMVSYINHESGGLVRRLIRGASACRGLMIQL